MENQIFYAELFQNQRKTMSGKQSRKVKAGLAKMEYMERMLNKTGSPFKTAPRRQVLLEIFAGAMMLSLTAIARGWKVLQPVDIVGGLNLMTKAARDTVDHVIATEDPDLIVAAPPCSYHSPLQPLGLGTGWK